MGVQLPLVLIAVLRLDQGFRVDLTPTLLDTDELTGTETWFHYDPLTETATYETRRDVGDITEFNKEIYKEHDERARWGNDFQHRVASIPDFLYWDLEKKLGPMKHNQKAWKAFLNDPDNRAFRTRPGRI
jgi:hypothetical protein